MSEEKILEGYLYKQGNMLVAWNSRWFVLTKKSLTYYQDNTLTFKRGEYFLDEKSVISIQSNTKFTFNVIIRGATLALCASDLSSFLSWDAALNRTILGVKLLFERMKVNLQICNNPLVMDVHEPLFEILLTTPHGNYCHRSYYNDIRTVYNNIIEISPLIQFSTEFPKLHIRDFSGRVLTPDRVENRRDLLEKWIQDVLIHHMDDLLIPQNVSFCIAENLFGMNDELLKSIIIDERERISKELEGSLETITEEEAAELEEIEKKEKIEMKSNLDDISLNANFIGNKSILTNLFGNVLMEEKSSPENENGKDVDDIVPLGDTVQEPLNAFHDRNRKRSSVDDYDIDVTTFQCEKSLLLKYDVLTLMKYCNWKGVDYKLFKCKKDFAKALISLDKSVQSFFKKKIARSVVKEFIQLCGDYSLVPANTVTDINTAFSCLLIEIGISELWCKMLSKSYSTQEKVDYLQKTVSVWESDTNMGPEDVCILTTLNNSIRSVDSILLLTLHRRIYQSMSNTLWLRAFCTLRGINTLVSIVDYWLEKEPLSRAEIPGIISILQSFRYIMDTECRDILLETRGIFNLFISTLRFEYIELALESIQLFSEIIIFGGEKMVANIVSEFISLARARIEEPFAILVNVLECSDISVQCAVINLINYLLLYERSVASRVELRCYLGLSDFDKKCTTIIKAIRNQGNTVISSASPTNIYYDMNISGNDCGRRKLRCAYFISDIDLRDSIADDGTSMVSPCNGIMASYAYEVVPGVGIGASNDASKTLESNSSTLLTNIVRRMSLNTVWKLPEEKKDDGRVWCKVREEVFSWGAMDGTRQLIQMVDVLEILDYAAGAVNMKGSMECVFSIVLKNAKVFNFGVSDVCTKQKWLVALTESLCIANLTRNAFKLKPSNVNKSLKLQLQKSFTDNYHIFDTLAREDAASIYTEGILNLMENPILVTRFLLHEFKRRQNDEKLYVVLRDLFAYATKYYGPAPPLTKEEIHDRNRLKYPSAVVDSKRSIPLAPILPFVPLPKPVKMSKIRLKQVYWTKIKPINVLNTIWMNMEEPVVSLDILETKFCDIQKRRKATGHSEEQNSGNKVSNSSHIQISLFDNKRIQNVAIAFAKMKKSPEELVDIILRMDTEELSTEINDTILNLLLPTPEESAILKAYTGDVGNLDNTGRLFYYFAEIERLEERLKIQRIILSWDEDAKAILDMVHTVEEAVSELMSLDCLNPLRGILSTILSIGNYLNGGSHRGQAHGFKLDILLKLRDMRQSSRGRGNLLHCIIEEMKILYPNIPSFYENWKHLWRANKIDMLYVHELLGKLEKSLEFCYSELEAIDALIDSVAKQTLQEKLGEFISYASNNYNSLRESHERVNTKVYRARKFFGENVAESNGSTSEEDTCQLFFKLFVNFADMCKSVEQELIDFNKQAEKSGKDKSTLNVPHHSNSRKNVTLSETHESQKSVMEIHKSTDKLIASFRDRMMSIRSAVVEAEEEANEDLALWGDL